VFTIIEELTGDSPGVGLPEGFEVKKKEYKFFRELQQKYNLTDLFITNHSKVKGLKEWNKIKKLINSYHFFWNKQKSKLTETKIKLEKEVNFPDFLERVQKTTKHEWIKKELAVFLTLGYKSSGTYDRKIDIIRLGIHETREAYLIFTLYHELIHYHIVNHMKLLLKEEKEEILCRAIFSILFKNNPTAQKHWKEYLKKHEIKKIKEVAKQL
jgi:hypothetical protein